MSAPLKETAAAAVERLQRDINTLGVSHMDADLATVRDALATAAWERDEARRIVSGLLALPSGCAFCDSGTLRQRVDRREPFHATECPWADARIFAWGGRS